jgi:UDP-N-acetylmuramyl pentapeptide phosphotransferase/UDP-N-acetylglucosamine-1-phosphate transferase
VPVFHQLIVIVLILAAVSAIDDRRGLPIKVRLTAHLGAAATAAWWALPTAPWWAIAAAFVCIVWAINLYNFMDGSDGMAGGMALFGFGTYACVSALMGAWSLAIVASAIAGAAVGFLVFNLPPARVFLGDAGSVALGFLAAVIGLLGWQTGFWPWTFPLLLFAPFVVDATATLVSRAARAERVWQPHRQHLYQKMVMGRAGHRGTAMIWYCMMSAAAVLATLAISWPLGAQILLMAAYAALYATATFILSRTAPRL